MKKNYTICEYQAFYKGNPSLETNNFKLLDENTFDALESFVEHSMYDKDNPINIMGLSLKSSYGKLLTAKNYVGLISMKDGTTIEILPKIAYCENNISETKRIFVEMLKTLHNFPCKNFQMSELSVSKLSIFEIFIGMFLDEVMSIVKKGLRSGYELKTDNFYTCKGKINFSMNIKKNLTHRERFFVEYDEFTLNRAENKLIKTTVELLSKLSHSSKNKKNIKILKSIFADIDISTDYKKDLAAVTIDRNMKEYRNIIKWCEIFLSGHSFTSFGGSNISLALLFPMESLFESYIAEKLKQIVSKNRFSISIQDKGCYLYDNMKIFALRPDIVLTRKSDNACYIMDTKWKLLSDSKINFGISQSDMYQMYVYGKKYNKIYGNVKNVFVLYPLTNEISNNKIDYCSSDEIPVSIRFVNLSNVEESVASILNECD